MLRTVAALLLLSSLALAGCSGDGSKGGEPVDDEDFDEFDLDATKDTGVIRGVVIDAAIVPIPGVQVVATGGEKTLETTTSDAGTFGFDGLEPGTYFVRASKGGYLDSQQSVEVEAGDDEPPITKLLLEADPVNTPFAQGYVFDGYIECSVSVILVGFAACNTVAELNDNFIVSYEPQRVPDYAQSEMFWDSTQAVNDGLSLSYSAPGNSTLLDNYAQDNGESPLLVFAERSQFEHYGVGSGSYPLQLRVFNDPIEGTRPSDPVNGDDCLDRPALGGCATGLGFTVEQEFAIYTHVFYGFTPDEGWLFSEDGEPTPP